MNVADVATDAAGIGSAVQAALSHGKWPCDNRYGDGLAGPRIVRLLMTLSLNRSVLEKINCY